MTGECRNDAIDPTATSTPRAVFVVGLQFLPHAPAANRTAQHTSTVATDATLQQTFGKGSVLPGSSLAVIDSDCSTLSIKIASKVGGYGGSDDLAMGNFSTAERLGTVP